MITVFYSALVVAAEPIELVCTSTPNSGFVTNRFSIDPAAATFSVKTSSGNNSYTTTGLAKVTGDAIVLTKHDDKITTVYKISRVTGDMMLESGLNDRPIAVRVAGSCTKFTGNVF